MGPPPVGISTQLPMACWSAGVNRTTFPRVGRNRLKRLNPAVWAWSGAVPRSRRVPRRSSKKRPLDSLRSKAQGVCSVTCHRSIGSSCNAGHKNLHPGRSSMVTKSWMTLTKLNPGHGMSGIAHWKAGRAPWRRALPCEHVKNRALAARWSNLDR